MTTEIIARLRIEKAEFEADIRLDGRNEFERDMKDGSLGYPEFRKVAAIDPSAIDPESLFSALVEATGTDRSDWTKAIEEGGNENVFAVGYIAAAKEAWDAYGASL